MTEPTHHLRADVMALVDVILEQIEGAVTPLERRLALERLRRHLSHAWHQGWLAGFDDANEHRPTTPNPYHETDIA